MSQLVLAKLLPDSAGLDQGGELHIADRNIRELVEEYGTPLYIFDRATIVHACRGYLRALSEHYRASGVRVIYAAKAYLAPHIARLVEEQGMGLDVVSGGELLVAQRAGFPMERVSFHGNNKSESELRLALRLGVGRIVLDNWSELELLTRLACEEREGQRPRVLLRIAPDVETDTHRYLQTGHAAAKFGFPLGSGEARAAAARIIDQEALELVGLHAHSGTMLRETRPYEECLERLLAFADGLYDDCGWWPKEVSPGGGWAIGVPGQEEVPGVSVLARALQAGMERGMARYGQGRPVPELIIEPGRSIIARAGVAVYRVGARKVTPGGVTYVFVDGGMADNIRPALYGARYSALAVERPLAASEERVCVAGRYCESGDMLIEEAELPRMREGELLLLPLAG
ncbi:MAG: diaminopimelate decarboxylase, partial [Ktedonobacteraceae bacterium]|nr:diaminopimelate decarboxylase [Ktedonobacteraceae bacterium]